MYGIRMSWGYRGDRLGYWVDNRHVEIFVVGFARRGETVLITTTTNAEDIRTESVEEFKRRIDHGNTGEPMYAPYW